MSCSFVDVCFVLFAAILILLCSLVSGALWFLALFGFSCGGGGGGGGAVSQEENLRKYLETDVAGIKSGEYVNLPLEPNVKVPPPPRHFPPFFCLFVFVFEFFFYFIFLICILFLLPQRTFSNTTTNHQPSTTKCPVPTWCVMVYPR